MLDYAGPGGDLGGGGGGGGGGGSEQQGGGGGRAGTESMLSHIGSDGMTGETYKEVEMKLKGKVKTQIRVRKKDRNEKRKKEKKTRPDARLPQSRSGAQGAVSEVTRDYGRSNGPKSTITV